jgi:hypothetical protein
VKAGGCATIGGALQLVEHQIYMVLQVVLVLFLLDDVLAAVGLEILLVVVVEVDCP